MNKLNICVFGGTKEGKMLAELLSDLNISADLFIKEEHGNRFVQNLEFIKVYVGITEDTEEKRIIDTFADKKYDLIIDATDYYDIKLSKKILKSALACSIKYIRAEINSAVNSSLASKDAIHAGCLNVEEICEYILHESYDENYA